jgi:hypothetical protein
MDQPAKFTIYIAQIIDAIIDVIYFDLIHILQLVWSVIPIAMAVIGNMIQDHMECYHHG